MNKYFVIIGSVACAAYFAQGQFSMADYGEWFLALAVSALAIPVVTTLFE